MTIQGIISTLSEHEGLTWGLSITSVVMFALSLAFFPWLVARAPADFFVREEPAQRTGKAMVLRVLKNLLGLVALGLGVAMLFLPGQGLLMVVLGVSMLDFPGKRRVQAWLVKKPSVQRGLGFLRRRAHKPPFQLP